VSIAAARSTPARLAEVSWTLKIHKEWMAANSDAQTGGRKSTQLEATCVTRSPFLADRPEGLLEDARQGRPRTIADDQVAAAIERTLRSMPKDATHWSIRTMAAKTGFSHTTI
jgi:hypothetical protein